MGKEFIPSTTVRNNAIKLAKRIHEDGFDPDVIYVSLRGGAYMGNVLSEYFKFIKRNQRPVFYAAVVARSYTDLHERDKVMVDGWTYSPEYLRSGDKILLVDDIFDSGKTINHLVEIILQKGIPREDVRIAVHDYKVRGEDQRAQPIQPDYYCRKHVIAGEEDDHWIHYLSHEIVGLTEKELDTEYGGDPEATAILKELIRQNEM
ncbi:MAG: phosphoribosyltransferase [Alkalispirochaetaceae bacterium]